MKIWVCPKQNPQNGVCLFPLVALENQTEIDTLDKDQTTSTLKNHFLSGLANKSPTFCLPPKCFLPTSIKSRNSGSQKWNPQKHEKKVASKKGKEHPPKRSQKATLKNKDQKGYRERRHHPIPSTCAELRNEFKVGSAH